VDGGSSRPSGPAEMARRSRLLECRRVDVDRARDDEEHAIVPEGNAASSVPVLTSVSASSAAGCWKVVE
jgi:hypothetical protein